MFVRSYLRMFNRRRITRRLDRRMKDPLPDTGIARKLFGNAHGIALKLFTQIRPQSGSGGGIQVPGIKVLNDACHVGFLFDCPFASTEIGLVVAAIVIVSAGFTSRSVGDRAWSVVGCGSASGSRFDVRVVVLCRGRRRGRSVLFQSLLVGFTGRSCRSSNHFGQSSCCVRYLRLGRRCFLRLASSSTGHFLHCGRSHGCFHGGVGDLLCHRRRSTRSTRSGWLWG